jgi:hypothetical protein
MGFAANARVRKWNCGGGRGGMGGSKHKANPSPKRFYRNLRALGLFLGFVWVDNKDQSYTSQ